MKQFFRHSVFETNSSSEHTLVLLKNNKDTISETLKAQIPIMENFSGYTTTPKTILSYIYTMGLLTHTWDLIYEIKKQFPECIFQKPQWDLPYESVTGYCDDREVTSFCELLNSSMICYYNESALETIKTHLKDFVFNGELYVMWDENYEDCVKDYHDVEDSTKVEQWISDNTQIVLRSSN